MEKKVYYGICATAADESEKVIELQGGQNSLPPINEGDLLTVHFLNKSSTAEITFTLTVNDHNNGTTSNNSGLPVKIRAAEPSSGNDNEWDFVDAWEEGEVKQFVAVSHYSEGDGNSTQLNGWEMLDGGNATTELYGDTKLFQPANAKTWLEGAPLDDEDNTAITPATIRELFKGQDEEEPAIVLNWTQVPAADDIKLGDLTISTAEDDPKGFYIPKAQLTSLIQTVCPNITHTHQLINDGNDPEDPEESSPQTFFIENYEAAPVEFSGGLTVSSPDVIDLIVDDTGKIPNLLTSEIKDISGTTVVQTNHGGVLEIGGENQSVKISGSQLALDPTGNYNSAVVYGNLRVTDEIYEGGTSLKNKYSGILFVQRYRTTTWTLNAKAHIHNLQFDITKSGWTPIGIVGWNLNQQGSSKTQFVYPWEMSLTGTTVHCGFRNTHTTDSVTFWLSIDILYVKNISGAPSIVNISSISKTWTAPQS